MPLPKPSPTRLRLETISKQFSLDHALTRLSLELRAGERLTLLGGRGSGKSTLAAILGGEVRPDAGQLQLDDHRYAPRNAREAREAGVASIISARWALPPSLTVAEALLLGIEPERMGWINRAQSREQAAQALAALRWDDIPLDAPLSRLPESHRRRVSLAKALMGQPRLIVLDEPGPLPQYDTEVFFSVLHERVAAGASLLLLSRSVDEARAMGGRVAILSRGELVGEQRAATMDAGTAIALMGGTPTALMGGTSPGITAHRRTNHRSHRRHRRHRMGRVLLALHEVSGSNVEGPVSLTVREGEIVGLAGLPGSGRRSLLRLVAGLDPLLSGDVHLYGRPVGRWSARRRMRAGLAPGMAGDELHLMDNLPVAENLLLPRLGELSRLGSVPPERKQLAARDWMEKLRIRPGSTRQKAGELARINRWKIALGRVLRSNARVLLLDDFSAGVDRPAREELHGWLAELAAEGRALLIVAPPADLFALCDTIGVMRQRKRVEIRAAADWSPETLQQSLSGHWHPRFQPSA